MRMLVAGTVLALSLGSIAVANPMVTNVPSDPPYIANPSANMYDGGPMFSAREVLSKLRRVCSSRNTTDKRACSRGMAVLKRGQLELQTRRAAESAVTD